MQEDRVVGIANGTFGADLTNPIRELEAIYRTLVSLRYILEGKEITVQTDCKALETLLHGVFQDRRLAQTQTKVLDLSLCLTIEHVKGENNSLADSLSRVAALELVDTTHLGEMQEGDLQIGEWIEMLGGVKGTPPSMKNTLKGMEVRDGLLRKDGVIVVPKDRAVEVVRDLHGGHGHLGKSRLIKLVRSILWCEGLTSLTKKVCSFCLTCAKGKPRTRSDQPNLGSWEVPAHSGSRVHLDHGFIDGEPFLVIVDALSSFWELVLVDSLTANESLIHLKSWCSRWGVPSSVVSDNATSFQASFKEEMERLGAECLTSPPFHPQGNGLAEGAVKQVKTLVAMKRLEDPALSLRHALVSSAMAHNLSPSSIHPFTPQQIQTGELDEDEMGQLRTSLTNSRSSQVREGYANLLEVGDRVVMTSYLPNALPFPFDGVVVGIEGDASILVDSGGRVYRRSREHLRGVELGEEEESDSEESIMVGEEIEEFEEEEETKAEELGSHWEDGKRSSLR